jgi:hypothetical protein
MLIGQQAWNKYKGIEVVKRNQVNDGKYLHEDEPGIGMQGNFKWGSIPRQDQVPQDDKHGPGGHMYHDVQYFSAQCQV